MNGPVQRKIQVITQGFKPDWHRGLDLRSVNFTNWRLQKIISTEQSTILRQGVDSYGNDYLVISPNESDYDEIKYIHVTFEEPAKIIGAILQPGDILGTTQIRQEIGRGNSYKHHLHFEVWRDKKPVNPLDYFDRYDISYKFKI